jgi:hypothetical protein
LHFATQSGLEDDKKNGEKGGIPLVNHHLNRKTYGDV